MIMVYLFLMVGIAGGLEQELINFSTFLLTELMAVLLIGYESQRLKEQERRRNEPKRRGNRAKYLRK